MSKIQHSESYSFYSFTFTPENPKIKQGYYVQRPCFFIRIFIIKILFHDLDHFEGYPDY
jgi:hypothetical protein